MGWIPSLGWEDPLGRKWQPTPVFLPEKFHGQRSLVGYNPWGRKRVGHDLVTKQHNNNLCIIWVLQRGAKAEDIGERSVPGRPSQGPAQLQKQCKSEMTKL